jgi:hypothetical protein
VLVAEGVGAVQAHLDLHFRLMHHDLLAELIDATCCFKALGGIGMLNARQRRQVCGHRGCRITVLMPPTRNLKVGSNATSVAGAVCMHPSDQYALWSRYAASVFAPLAIITRSAAHKLDVICLVSRAGARGHHTCRPAGWCQPYLLQACRC